MRHLPQMTFAFASRACLLLLLALPVAGAAKDHQHDIDRAKLAADHGEPARAKYILRQALRKDPRDPALQQALEDLIHPPKATPTPTTVPTPKPTPAPKPNKVKVPDAPKAKVKPKPKESPAKAPTEAKALPTVEPKAKASDEAPLVPLGARIKARLKGWLPGWGRHPAPPPVVVKETPLPCRTVTYIYFGKTRTGKLLKDLPRSSELMVGYNKGKLKIARDQVVKIVDCL